MSKWERETDGQTEEGSTMTLKWLDLPRDCYLIVGLISNGTLSLVSVVECDGHCSFGNACLPSFVHQLLQTACPHLHTAKGERTYTALCAVM